MNKWLIITILILVALLIYRIVSVQTTSQNQALKQLKAPQDSTYDLLESNESQGEDSLNFVVEVPIKSAVWDTLMDISYDSKGDYGYIPKFKPPQEKLNGKKITIQGYMYPLEEKDPQTFFMLSRNPVSACFFCGGAGPETVIEVNSPKGVKMHNKPVKIRGVLELNKKNTERLFYILNEAEKAD